jgi:YD repeat-containing protein
MWLFVDIARTPGVPHVVRASQYDSANNRSSLLGRRGMTRYTFDEQGRLLSITHDIQPATSTWSFA